MYTLKELLKDYEGKYEGLEVSLYEKYDEIEEVKDYFISGVEDEEQDEEYEEYCKEVKECTTLEELYDVLIRYDDYSNAGAYDLRLEDINE